MIDWVTPAFAQSGQGGAPPGGGPMGSLVMLGLMFLIFYFLLIRPQQKRAKEHQQLVDSLERGDEVVLQGGLHGKVTGVTDKVLTVEIADGVRIKADRQSVVRRKRNGDG